MVDVTQQHPYRIGGEDVPVDALRAEALVEWDKGQLPCSATTVVGAFVLSIAATSDGLHEIAGNMMDQVFELCKRLEWFGDPIETPRVVDEDKADQLKVDAHASWGVFNYTT